MPDRSRYGLAGFVAACLLVFGVASLGAKPVHQPASASGRCAPDSSSLSMLMLDWFKVTATGASEGYWSTYKGVLRLTARLNSAQIQLETADAACGDAIAAYEARFPGNRGTEVVVVKFDTLRSITLVPPPRDSLAPISTGLGPHLITNADFSVVIGTIFE